MLNWVSKFKGDNNNIHILSFFVVLRSHNIDIVTNEILFEKYNLIHLFARNRAVHIHNYIAFCSHTFFFVFKTQRQNELKKKLSHHILALVRSITSIHNEKKTEI